MSDSPESVYKNTEWDDIPGAHRRTRPGTAPREQIYDTVLDAYGNQVSSKPANQPFLKGQRARLEHQARSAAQEESRRRRAVEKEKERQRKRASFGDDPPSLFPRIIIFILFLPFLCRFFTGSWDAGLGDELRPYFRKMEEWWPWRRELQEFTPLQLAFYDGTPDRPVYLAIAGEVYDVSKNRRVYGKGGSYNMMTGRDASRAFVTGCFETHLTHDVRGLSPDEMKGLEHWRSFFANHKDYHKIGHILNPLDPQTPIPPPCREEPDSAPGATANAHAHAKPAPVSHGS
ncbi:hypothetical protein M231_06038 [Tremella mesenterica]|uniref:Cytochrome b5 heme-binding domain-containing protein n=1 Tax=Tremella mesenterica TaxID=5217 RepID=A0A4Q1BGF9_TREME|nr:hypothetical protein M231_06038 [Tremella mesenterica]